MPEFLSTVGGQDFVHTVTAALCSIQQDAAAQRKALEELTAIQAMQGEALGRIAAALESVVLHQHKI